MSLTLALWLILVVAFFAFRLGRLRGRVDVAQELAPILPLLEQLSQMAEALGAELSSAELSSEVREQLDALRKASAWN